MPFVTKEHRDDPFPDIPGDRCYVEYKKIMDQWRKNPRWTTVDEIFSSIIPVNFLRVKILALMVFFVLEVIPYELKKKKENGEI